MLLDASVKKFHSTLAENGVNVFVPFFLSGIVLVLSQTTTQCNKLHEWIPIWSIFPAVRDITGTTYGVPCRSVIVYGVLLCFAGPRSTDLPLFYLEQSTT